jgi:hypothetical protein
MGIFQIYFLICFIGAILLSNFHGNFMMSFRRLKDFHINVNVLAEAFKKINNPLVIVSLGKNCSQFLCPDVIFVDMTVKQCREDILRVLFPKTVKALQGQTGIIEVETTNSCSEVLSSGSYGQEGCKLAPSNFVLNNIMEASCQ